jgi:hypothetical protein
MAVGAFELTEVLRTISELEEENAVVENPL